MKDLFISLVIFLTSISGIANPSTPYATITGTINEYRKGEMILYKAGDGNRQKYASFQNTESLDFSFLVPVKEEGLYYLSDQSGWWYIRLYIKPGDQLELKISYPGNYQIVKGSPENKLLYEWFKTVSAVIMPAFNTTDTITYHSFFSKVKELLPAGDRFKKKIISGSFLFKETLKQIVAIDVEYAALRFCFTPRTDTVTALEHSAYIKQFIVPQKYCNAQLLKLGESNDLLGLYASAASQVNYVERKGKRLGIKELCTLFCNDTIKGAYVSSNLERYKFYDKFIEDIVPLEHYFVTASQKKKYEEKRKQFNPALAKGNMGFNFSFPDSSGKTVSMMDFKGKVVLMDMWATWCKPCIGEIPHLKNLEKAFGEKDVVFVGVSFDEEKDNEKWKNFVHDNELAGVQLFASGFGNKLADFYKINAIPRFLVFDKEGKIVSVDAPRPSEPELKELLEATLDQK